MSRNRGFDRDSFTNSSSSMPSWLEEFADNFEKNATTAVDEARRRQAEQDYFSQISSIVGGGKRKHATVDSIVAEYQELTGLKKYLKTLSDKENTDSQVKISQAQLKSDSQTLISVGEDSDLLSDELKPSLKEKIKIFVKNKINSYNGHISIPAIQDDLLRTLKNEGLEPYHVYDASLAKYIGNILNDYLKDNPIHSGDDSQLGKAIIEVEEDGSNKDFLHSLQNKNK